MNHQPIIGQWDAPEPERELNGASTSEREIVMNEYENRAAVEPQLAEAGPVQNAPSSNYEINIRTLEFGYVVGIGCHSFAFETKERLLDNLTEYLADPAKAQQKWWETKQPLK